MKKTLLMLVLALIATTSFAQNDPLSVRHIREGRDTSGILLTQAKAANIYATLIQTTETASAHNYSVLGKNLVIVTTTRKDTINLLHANYSTGRYLNFLCTNASNDSSLIIPDAGNINGAASYWFNGTYKALTLYYDGTNYWITKKQ